MTRDEGAFRTENSQHEHRLAGVCGEPEQGACARQESWAILHTFRDLCRVKPEAPTHSSGSGLQGSLRK